MLQRVMLTKFQDTLSKQQLVIDKEDEVEEEVRDIPVPIQNQEKLIQIKIYSSEEDEVINEKDLDLVSINSEEDYIAQLRSQVLELQSSDDDQFTETEMSVEQAEASKRLRLRRQFEEKVEEERMR